MKFTACECRAEHYRRVRRSAWMRIFSARRLYRCLGCDETLFIRTEDAVGSPFRDTVPQPHPSIHDDAPRHSRA